MKLLTKVKTLISVIGLIWILVGGFYPITYAQYGSTPSNPIRPQQGVQAIDEEEPGGFLGMDRESFQRVATVAVVVAAPTATIGGAIWWLFLKPI